MRPLCSSSKATRHRPGSLGAGEHTCRSILPLAGSGIRAWGRATDLALIVHDTYIQLAIVLLL